MKTWTGVLIFLLLGITGTFQNPVPSSGQDDLESVKVVEGIRLTLEVKFGELLKYIKDQIGRGKSLEDLVLQPSWTTGQSSGSLDEQTISVDQPPTEVSADGTELKPEQAGSEPGPEAGSEQGPEAGSEPGPEAGSKPGPEAGSEQGPEAGSKPGPEAGSEPGPEAGSEQGPGPIQTTETEVQAVTNPPPSAATPEVTQRTRRRKTKKPKKPKRE